MKTERLKLSLEIEVDIDGRSPDDLRAAVIAALDAAVPSVLLDDEEQDVILFTKSWAWE